MMDRRIIGGTARRPLRRFARLLSLLLVSTIGLGIVQPGGDTALEDEADQDERVVFRHFV